MLGSLQGLPPSNHQQQGQQQQLQQPQQQLQQNQPNTIPPPPPQNGQDVTLSSVLHFLQSEWRRYERDRNEWEIERAEMRVSFMLATTKSSPMTFHRLESPYSRVRSDLLTMSSSTLCDALKCSNSSCAWNGTHFISMSYVGPDIDTLARSNSLNQVLRQSSEQYKLMSLQLVRRMTPEATKRRAAGVPLEVKVGSFPYFGNLQLRLFLQTLHFLKADCRTVDLF